MDWDVIIREWHGSVSKEAIAEAVRLAKAALIGRDRRRGNKSAA